MEGVAASGVVRRWVYPALLAASVVMAVNLALPPMLRELHFGADPPHMAEMMRFTSIFAFVYGYITFAMLMANIIREERATRAEVTP